MMNKTKSSSRRGIHFGFFLLILAALAVLAALLLILPAAFLTVSQPLKPADAVVVLSGGEGRVDYATRLFQEIGAKWFIITETGDWVPGYPESVSEFDGVRAKRLGVPESSIHITPRESSTTAGEASAVREFVLDEGIKSIVVVTDPFHTRRAQLLFWKTLRGTGVRIRMRAVEGHPYHLLTWWLHHSWRRITLQEYAKIAYTIYEWIR